MAQKKSTTLEVTRPLDTMQFAQMVRWAGEAAGLSKWEQFRLQTMVKRQRAELIGKLTEVEHQVVLAEALEAAEGRLEAARERAAADALIERMRCLGVAARCLDDSLASIRGCSEESQDILAPAMQRQVAMYARTMERRAGGWE